jgi:hypothetical protein
MHRVILLPVQALLNLLFLTTSEVEVVEEEDEQADSGPRFARSLGGYYLIEKSQVSIEDAKKALEERGFRLPAKMQGGGGGVLVNRRNTIIETGGQGRGGDEETDTHHISAGYGGGHIDFGKSLINRSFMRVFPFVGFGGMGGGVDTVAKDGSNEAAKAADKDDSKASIGWGSGTVSVGLGIDFTLRLWRFGLLLGLRFGIYAPLLSAAEGTETVSLEGPFFRIIVGPRLFV